jgi:hypothetical protein
MARATTNLWHRALPDLAVLDKHVTAIKVIGLLYFKLDDKGMTLLCLTGMSQL